MGEKLRVIARRDNTIEVELVGEDHTLANLVAKYAVRHPKVRYAAYQVPHPLAANPIVVITTDGTQDPYEVLREVLKNIINDIGELRKTLIKAFASDSAEEQRGDET